MLTFSTVFPLAENCTPEDVALLMKRWIIGSQHSAFGEELELAGVGEKQWQESRGKEGISGISTKDSNTDYVAIRWENTDNDDVTWTTDVIFEGAPDGNRVSIQVRCESETTVLRLPPARKPYIVRQLISEFGGAEDGALKVSDEPVQLSNADIEYAADMISSNCGNILPIAYLSAPTRGEFLVSGVKLAHWLSGIAHVVIEPNREFSFRLMQEVNHQNAYGGP